MTKTKRIVLFGLAETGKTTLCQWLLKKITDINESRFPPTIEYSTHTQVINNTKIDFFDLGGAIGFLDRFIGELAELMFRGVTTIVFMIDSLVIKDMARAKYYLNLCIQHIETYNPRASVMVFQHKIDLIPKKMRGEVSETLRNYLSKGVQTKIIFYDTSMFNSSIVVAACAMYQATLGYIPNNVIPEPFPR